MKRKAICKHSNQVKKCFTYLLLIYLSPVVSAATPDEAASEKTGYDSVEEGEGDAHSKYNSLYDESSATAAAAPGDSDADLDNVSVFSTESNDEEEGG